MRDNNQTDGQADGLEQPDPAKDEAGQQNSQFLELYGVAYPRIYAFILSLLPDKVEADEILQETSIVLWRRFDDFDPQGNFIRWACGIASNQIRKFRRERARSAMQLSDEAWERIAAVHERQSEFLEQRRLFLNKCVESLPEDDLLLLRSCCERTASIKKVAEELNRPVNTVYKAMKRIRTVLKRCVDLAMRRKDRP